jgi:SAM-dependent methyltransferase
MRVRGRTFGDEHGSSRCTPVVVASARSLRCRALRRLRPRRRIINSFAKLRAKVRRPRLITRVAEDEDMLTGGDDLRNYFEVGESALTQIRAGLSAAEVPAPKKILDLPCGYGRVLRHLRAEFPKAEITAMDINAQAVAFCAKTFAARPVLSRQPLWEVDAGDAYDLIWCGSLLTHFDAPDWVPTLSYFRDRLAPDGLAIFTTHGELSIRLLAGETIGSWSGDYHMGKKASAMADAARRTGFAFGHYGDTQDPYGLSVSTPEWVRSKTAEIAGLTFVSFSREGWFGHHDVWTYRAS